MDEKALVESVALFYYFLFLDEVRAKAAAVKTLNRCRRRMDSQKSGASEVESILVHATNMFVERMAYKYKPGQQKGNYQLGWIVPTNIDLGPWREFKKHADKEVLLATLWSQIVNISDAHIAKGLGVSVGTVRYRVGKGLRELGRIQQLRGADE